MVVDALTEDEVFEYLGRFDGLDALGKWGHDN
jgi:hypothetical protein